MKQAGYWCAYTQNPLLLNLRSDRNRPSFPLLFTRDAPDTRDDSLLGSVASDFRFPTSHFLNSS